MGPVDLESWFVAVIAKHLVQLCSRIRAIQRRISSCVEPVITVGDISLEPATRLVFKLGQKVEMSRREFVLMKVLVENAGCVLTKERIMQSLYGWGDDIDSNALEVHIHNLRKKFGHKTISTVRGVGYVLEKQKSSKILKKQRFLSYDRSKN
jgi:two-component system response regulator QseB